MYNNLLLTSQRKSDSMRVRWEGTIFRHFYNLMHDILQFPHLYTLNCRESVNGHSLNFKVKNFTFTCQIISTFDEV